MVVKKLAKQFKTPKDAEAHYFPINIHTGIVATEPIVRPIQPAEVRIEVIPNVQQGGAVSHTIGELSLQLLTQLPPDDRIKTISALLVQ